MKLFQLALVVAVALTYVIKPLFRPKFLPIGGNEMAQFAILMAIAAVGVGVHDLLA